LVLDKAELLARKVYKDVREPKVYKVFTVSKVFKV
jgi:hypothetical protein